jgi:hypothetical protein
MDLRKNDILLGRGPFCYRFPGNVKFRKLIQSQVAKYDINASRSAKQGIVQSLIKAAHELGYRFLVLSKNDNNWYEAHPYVVQSKVSHALRDARSHATSIAAIMKKNYEHHKSCLSKRQQKKKASMISMDIDSKETC